jgi:hypothetical protein
VSEPTTFPAPIIPPQELVAIHRAPDFSKPPRDKFEREYRAFWLMLPQLLKTHRNLYVAVHDGQLVDSDADNIALALRVYAKIGYIPIYVGLVTDEPQPLARIPYRRSLDRPQLALDID